MVVLILFCLSVSFKKTFELMDHHETHIAQEAIHHEAMGGQSISVDPLEHEIVFIDTIKDCIPGGNGNGNDNKKNKNKKEKCGTFIPNEESGIERVAVLAPPGTTTKMLLKFINIVLMKGMKTGKDGTNVSAKTLIEVLPVTNMAPYGYGKTHGYTRIISVLPQPLLMGATDTLKAAVESLSKSSSVSKSDITLNDLKAALRQQVRYTCRLNHIAAHTAIWSIGLEDFAEIERDVLVEKAQDFFQLKSQENLFSEVIAEYEQVIDDDKVIEGGDDDDNALVRLNSMYAEGESLLSLIKNNKNNGNKDNDILKILDDVLLDEMKISKNLTEWPCESFWTVGEPDNRLEISPIIRSISKSMSPNCDAPHTSCFVKRDKCEFKGDGKCI